VLQQPCPSPCGPAGQVWVGLDYLLWGLKSASTPPLVVQDAPGTPRTAVGIPGTPGQRTLFGGSGINDDLRSGARLSGGLWLDDGREWGLDFGAFFLERGGDSGTFFSPGTPPLSRPFFNVRTGRPDAELVSFPGVLSGAVGVSSGTNLYGGSAALRSALCCDCGYRVDLLTGYRFLHLGDSLRVREDLTAVGQGSVPPGTRLVVQDSFQTSNNFHGGLVGLAGEWFGSDWSFAIRGSVAIGQSAQEASVTGNTTVTVPGGAAATGRPGGLLAQSSNGGTTPHSAFAVAPEVGLEVGYQVTSNARVHVGYSFLYLSSVMRAGDQVDLGVDPARLSGAAALGRPAPLANRTDFWAQGVNVGFTLRF
jgi:hypothetical protein